MANNILKYKNFSVGKSIYENKCEDIIKNIFDISKKHPCSIVYPDDVVTGKNLNREPIIKAVSYTHLTLPKKA